MNLSLARELARDWKMIVVRGVLAILFGVVFLFAPIEALTASVALFAIFAIVLGVLALVAGFFSGGDARWPLVVEGVLGIAVGLIALAQPGLTLVAFVAFIAAWAIITGVVQIYQAIKVREEIDDEWWLGLGGAASVVFGILIWVQPALGILTVAYLIGIYAIVFGVLIVMLGLRLKDFAERRLTAAPA